MSVKSELIRVDALEKCGALLGEILQTAQSPNPFTPTERAYSEETLLAMLSHIQDVAEELGALIGWNSHEMATLSVDASYAANKGLPGHRKWVPFEDAPFLNITPPQVTASQVLAR